MARDRLRMRGMRFPGDDGAGGAGGPGRPIEVDVELALDLRPAGESDDRARSVGYAEVYEQVRAVAAGPPCALMETVAERIAARLLGAHPSLEEVCVRVRRSESEPEPDVSIGDVAATTEVEIVRARMRAVKVGMSVRATDGRAGRVDDVLVDGETDEPSYVVIDAEGGVFANDVVVPYAHVRSVDDAGVWLDLTRDEVRRSPAFDGARFGAAAGLLSTSAQRYGEDD